MEGGPAVVLRQAAQAWHPLWARDDHPHPQEPQLLMGIRDLPAFPPLAPLGDEEVVQAVTRLPLRRAPGPDGWAGEELRLWPRPLVVALVAMLRTVEALGRWPLGLWAAEVVRLPKPGGDPDQPLQKRPIALLPVIYRLWARLRLRQVDAWRAAWDPAVASLTKGPEGQAWGLAWELAVAPASGHTICGVTVDLTKCYDSVRLPLLRRALAAAGWPAGVVGPFLSAYSAPRRLRVGEASGVVAPPKAGLLAGCPSAVSALAVLTWPWQLAVARAGATSARRYVDDLTARVRGLRAAGPGLASAVWLESALYAEATQLALNLEKPGVFSGCYGGGFDHGDARLPLGNGEQGLPALCGPRGDRGASALGVPLVAGQLRSSGDDVLDQKLWELTARPSGGGSPGRYGRRRSMLDVALRGPRARASIWVRRPRREPSAMATLHG